MKLTTEEQALIASYAVLAVALALYLLLHANNVAGATAVLYAGCAPGTVLFIALFVRWLRDVNRAIAPLVEAYVQAALEDRRGRK